MVKPKKQLGQHFLKDETIAEKIVSYLDPVNDDYCVLEIGAGTGVLTKYLEQKFTNCFFAIDVDIESIRYLHKNFPQLKNQILHNDFLKVGINSMPKKKINIIGNFPYNISSQIFFKILEYPNQIDSVVCMLQKEVAKRLSSAHGSKSYGILSVLLQVHYSVEYLFDVEPSVFYPPPNVNSGVIKLTRNNKELNCNPLLFKKIVKHGFNQRRKTLKNALKPLNLPFSKIISAEILNKRAEALTVNDFEKLTKEIEKWIG